MRRQHQTWWITLVCGLFFIMTTAGCSGGGSGDDDGRDSGNGGGAVNTAPTATAPPIETIEDTPGASQISVSDPDAGQAHTFTIVTPPLGGMATVDSAGLVTYTPDTGFAGMDSLVVEVADSGDPPRVGTVTLNITVISVEMPATADDLTQRAFLFFDGGAFDAALTGNWVTLIIREFDGQVGSFELHIPDWTASGTVTIGSCIFAVEFSTFPPGEGPQAGAQIVIDPCTIDPRDGHLILVNADTGAVSVSQPPTGLSGEPGDGGGGQTTFDVTGRWTGTFQSNRGGSGTVEMNLTQSGDTVTGDFMTTSLPPPGGFFCSPGTIDATVSGNMINGRIIIDPAAGSGTTNFDGTIVADGNAMFGTYSVAGGSCNGDSGTFDITLSPPPVTPPDSPGAGTLIEEPFDVMGVRFDRHEIVTVGFVGEFELCDLRVRFTEIAGAVADVSCNYVALDSAGASLAISFFTGILEAHESLTGQAGLINPVGGPTACEDIVTLQLLGCAIRRP